MKGTNRLAASLVTVVGLLSFNAYASPITINTIGSDQVAAGSAATVLGQIELELQAGGLFGGLPTLGQDGVSGYALHNPAGLGGLGLNVPGVPLASLNYLVVNEFKFASPADAAAARTLLGSSPSQQYVESFANVDTVVPQLPSLLAQGAPAADVVTGSNSTAGPVTAGQFAPGGGTITEEAVGGGLTYYTITTFYLDAAPFIADGQIANASQFTPFGIRLELIPLGFLPADSGPEAVSVVPGSVVGGQTVGVDESYSFTAVPEPAGWTVMVTVLGLAGLARRRHRACSKPDWRCVLG